MADNSDFFDRVWDVVAEIPHGRVTTYGHIAAHLGSKRAARTVGWALKAAAGKGLPCHRVVNRFGGLSGQHSFGGPYVMEDLLRSEGVEFVDETTVDIRKHLWVPGEDLAGTSQPRFIHNVSGRFESRFSTVRIEESPSIMLEGMADSVLGVWVAHGEGQAYFPDDAVRQSIEDRNLVALRYADDSGEPTERYPHNPCCHG